ncbi:sugar phosphate isomerase/epimerase family protein [Luteitalea sp.]
MIERRAFLMMAVAAGARAGARQPEAPRRGTSMYLAYTSFAVRLAQGRDLVRTSAAGFGPDVFRDLCTRFGAAGAQIDLSQLPADPAALPAIRDAFARAGVAVELSLPARVLESPAAYAQAVSVARALGVRCARVALLAGRRYETFATADAWGAFSAHWHETLIRMRPEFERHQLAIGIENHKDWCASELVALLRAVDSRYVGACVDFGNNLALLEPPDETIALLAPFAITTHLKDMAVRRTAEGFDLSEVPLGQGILPLGRYVERIRAARPEARLCLEMITRDPLSVPCRTDRYWTTFGPSPTRAERLERFEDAVLSQARADLPRVSGLSPEAQRAAEDDNVRACVTHARDVLHLERN